MKHETMKALYYDRYGPSEVLSIRDMPMPRLRPGRLLVKVHAASVNPLDWRLMQADPFLARFFSGILKPKLNGFGAQDNKIQRPPEKVR